MAFSVSHRMIGQPMNTGSQPSNTRYSSTDGTAIAAGTPKLGGAEEDQQRDMVDPLHRLLQCGDRRGGAQSARPFFCRNLDHSARVS
jgi:hypothetical protein